MSKDPAFLFYDGDAARDVSHMTRLERGCYFDLIQAQKKFGRLSEEIIRKVLGKDFDECWENVKISLSYVDRMYFIEWLEDSINKRKNFCESRKHNRLSIKDGHMSNISLSYEKHMVIENEDVKENKIEDKILTELEKCIESFKDHRKKIKKPMTDRAVELLKIQLEKLAPDNDDKKIDILNQSIFNGWQGIFELKQGGQSGVNNQFQRQGATYREMQ